MTLTLRVPVPGTPPETLFHFGVPIVHVNRRRLRARSVRPPGRSELRRLSEALTSALPDAALRRAGEAAVRDSCMGTLEARAIPVREARRVCPVDIRRD